MNYIVRYCKHETFHPTAESIQIEDMMSALTEFFHGSDTRLGVFYPTHYLVAVFPNPQLAAQAVSKLRNAGFSQSEAIATDGSAVIELDKEETGLASYVMQSISRLIGTEQMFTDHDLDHARHGAGFVAVHCETEESKKSAWKVLQAQDPLDARYYAAGAIEHLAGDLKTD